MRLHAIVIPDQHVKFRVLEPALDKNSRRIDDIGEQPGVVVGCGPPAAEQGVIGQPAGEPASPGWIDRLVVESTRQVTPLSRFPVYLGPSRSQAASPAALSTWGIIAW